MTIEGPQRGGLALDGRAGGGRAAVPLRQLGQEIGDVSRRCVLGRPAAPAEEHAELEQVGAVGLEGVARHAPFQLQVGEEIEHQLAEPGRGLDGRVCHPHWFLARRPASLARNRCCRSAVILSELAERLQLAPDDACRAATHEREAFEQPPQRAQRQPI